MKLEPLKTGNNRIVKEAMRLVSKDVRLPKRVRAIKETTPKPILFGMFLTGRDRESVERDFELWKLRPQESGE